MKCLILAGGFGTRLWPLTKDRPKPMLKINGQPIINHIVNKIPPKLDIIISINRRFEKDFIEWEKNINRNVTLFVEDAMEDGKKLGAVGALNYLIKKENIKEDLLVVGGDNYFEFSLNDFLASYQDKPLVAVYDMQDIEKVKRYGAVKTDSGKITELIEKPERPETTLISTAVYLLPATCFCHLHDFCSLKRDHLGEFIRYLIEKEEVMAWMFDEAWFDIGNFEDYLNAHVVSTKTIIREKGTSIVNSSVQGAVHIGENTRIKDSLVKDSIIMENCLIEKSAIQNSIVDRKSIIRESKIDLGCIGKESIIANGEYKK